MISFIVPAHNEQAWIGRCLRSIHGAMEAVERDYEIIVVDDASTDETSTIATSLEATVLRVNHRHVSAVRNTGAAKARGTVWFFVDADTEINAEAVAACLAILESGAVGAGCVFEFDSPIPWWAACFHRLGVILGRWLRLTGGCFLCCTPESFKRAGGFAEALRAGEDMAFVQALKKQGRFEIARPVVRTSARKLKVVGFWEVLLLVLTILVRGSRYESKRTLDFMYGTRAQACRHADNQARRQ